MKRQSYQTPFTDGPKGLAYVTPRKDKLFVQFVDEKNPRVKKDSFLVEAPEGVTWELTNELYSVSLNGAKDRLYGIRPANGPVTVKFTRFTAKKDQPPIPKLDNTPGRKKDGGSYPKHVLKFNALSEILEGPHAGMEVLQPFLYAKFSVPDDDRPATQTGGFKDDGDGYTTLSENKDDDRIAAWLEAMQVADLPIIFSENILPTLENICQEHGHPYMIVLERGWPVSYIPVASSHLSKSTARKSPKAAPKAKAKSKK